MLSHLAKGNHNGGFASGRSGSRCSAVQEVEAMCKPGEEGARPAAEGTDGELNHEQGHEGSVEPVQCRGERRRRHAGAAADPSLYAVVRVTVAKAVGRRWRVVRKIHGSHALGLDHGTNEVLRHGTCNPDHQYCEMQTMPRR